MEHSRTKKLFGVGPVGFLISLALSMVFGWANRRAGHPCLTAYTWVTKDIGIALIIIGLGLHFWSLATLRNWWQKDRLCTGGPFKWFRHPLYAAWVTFIAPGIAVLLNSWILLVWAALLQPIWHWLVRKEEKMMMDRFGDEYRAYAARTGRFIPRILNH
jgi:protein-S-isoprenylcysteine O-methyltransferase Ste14